MRLALAVLVMTATTAHAERSPAPELAAASVIVVDARTGDEVYAKAADEPRPIASLTKLFAALVVRSRHLDLDAWTTITDEDAKAAEGGAGTRLLRGEAFRNLDLLHAMMLVSDNRVPTALARSVKLTPRELLVEMNELAAHLGLAQTAFTDVTGIAGNQSTARELASAFRRTLVDPLLARIMRTRYARFTSQSERVIADYTSTLLPLHGWRSRPRGKTGTTESAGHCMVLATDVADRSIVIVLLGGPSNRSRFDDATRLLHWLR